MESLYEVALIEYNNRLSIESECLDRYRTILEPYIYHYLIEHYSGMLNQFWTNYLPPLHYKYAFVIVERRAHPNFEFILKNIAWSGPKMAVYIFCSDVNIGFIKAILGTKASSYNIKAVFTGLGTRESGKTDYSTFLTNADTYKMIDAEYIITVQMDTFFRRAIPDEIFTGIYWGNPWAWKLSYAGGGGATVRKVADMIRICETNTNHGEAEDSWFADRIIENGAWIPPLPFRAEMIMESLPSHNPVIIHQFWTYLDHYFRFPKEAFIGYWKHLLTIG